MTALGHLMIEDIVQRAVGQALEEYRIEHPNISDVLERINVDTDVIPRIRETAEYKAAEEKYVQARIEIDFFNNLLEIAKTVLPMILAAI